MPDAASTIKPSRGTPIIIGVLILLVAALVVAGIYTELLGRRAYDNIQRATDLLLDERVANSLLIDMETSTRGYTITGDQQFLQPYNDAQAQLPGLWTQLSTAIGHLESANRVGRAELEADLSQAMRDADSWQNGFAAKQIDLRSSGRTAEAIAQDASGRGKQLFDAFRASSKRLNDALDARLRQYSTDLNNIRETELGLLAVLGTLTLISAFFALRVYGDETRLQQEITRQLNADRQRLQAVIDNLPVGVRLVVVPGSKIILQNYLAEELFPSEIWNSLTRQERIEYFRLEKPGGGPLAPGDTPVSRVLAERGPVSDIEFTMVIPNGARRHLMASAAPIRDEGGAIESAVVVIQDVTRMRDLDQRKDEFIAIAAHELRNPLAAMSGYNQLIQRLMGKGAITQATIERNLTEMDKQITRLNNLVERLLDASRIQLGRIILDKSRQDLVKIAQTVVEDIRGMDADAHKIVLTAPRELTGCWDPVRLEQIITNLMSNAVRHTPANGTIELKLEARDDGASVRVIDEGPGIAPEQRARLFDRYYQTNTLSSGVIGEPGNRQPRAAQRKQGLGLGLYISSELVKAHKGRIGIAPNPEGGSIFWFSVPYGEC